MCKILLCGCFGKMGRVVAECVNNRPDATVVAGVDVTAGEAAFPTYTALSDVKETVDVIIDFSHPSALDGILNYAEEKKIAAVLATTGYSDEQTAKIKAASSATPLFFSFNMSLGINLLVELSKKAAEILGEDFDVEIVEAHHNQKLDAPSGTAVMLADSIMEVLDDKELVYDRHDRRAKREKKEIGMHAIRGGTIVGEHSVIFAGRDEIVTLSHSARSKEVFAAGAVSAACFMADKKPGLYNMKDLVAEK